MGHSTAILTGSGKSSYAECNAMNGKTAIVLLLGLLAACAQTQQPEATAPPEPAPAQTPAQAPAPAPAPAAESTPVDHVVNIQGARCQDLLRLSPEDRDAASMFYIGYQASRLRARTINVGMIPSIEAQAVTYCAENPGLPVVQAFAEAYSRTRR
jgi:HdeA/HdeB family